MTGAPVNNAELVYEHGVVIRQADRAPHGLALIATSAQPIYSDFTWNLLAPDGTSLSKCLVESFTVQGMHWGVDYYQERDLNYVLRACAYHLDNLLSRYVWVNTLFTKHHNVHTSIRGNTGDARAFYEIDAFLAATRRAYDTIRRVLWKHYGKGKECRPRSLHRLFKESSIDLPPSYREAWARTEGSVQQLTAYRDTIIHNDPPNDSGTTCWVEPFGGRWGTTIKLSANPEAKSRLEFDYLEGPDALQYCYARLLELIEFVKLTEQLEPIKLHLSDPPSSHPRDRGVPIPKNQSACPWAQPC